MKQRFHYSNGKNRDGEDVRRILWWCPGFDEIHAAHYEGTIWSMGVDGVDRAVGPWALTKGADGRPSLSPSYLVLGCKSEDPRYRSQPRCHGYLQHGRYSFCGDSEHALAGQTVDLPEWEP